MFQLRNRLQFWPPYPKRFCQKDNVFEINVHKMPKSSARHPYWIKITNIKKCSSKDFYGNEEKYFWLSARNLPHKTGNFLLNVRKFWAQWPKTAEKHFPQEKILSSKLSSGHVDCTFRDFPETSLINGRFSFAQCPETIKIFFLNRSFLSRVILWTSIKRFWKSCYFFCVRGPKKFRWNSEKLVKKTFSFQRQVFLL